MLFASISGKKISTNSPASPGINYKTGDIIALEKSFSEFLLTIYEKIKEPFPAFHCNLFGSSKPLAKKGFPFQSGLRRACKIDFTI